MTEYKKIHNINVSKDCYKKLKIISIQKDLPLVDIVAELLEKMMRKKHNLQEEVI